MDLRPFAYEVVPVGEEFEAEIALTPELVREYCEAIGDPNPWYTQGSPLGGPIVPPTLVAQLPLRLLKTKYETKGWVHVKHDTTFLRPAQVGKTIRLWGRISDKYIRREREWVEWEWRIVDEAGDEICRGKSTGLFRYQKRSPEEVSG